MLVCADKDRTAKEQHQIHRQNGRGGLDGAAIDSASKKLGTIALAEGRSGIGNQTASVVVFMPPAVEPGEPPMSIKRIITPCDAPDIADRFTVLKPAVLGVTD